MPPYSQVRMGSRTSARWLAPLALIAAVVALLVTVAAGGGGGSSDSAGTDAGPAATTSRSTTATGTTATTATTTTSGGGRRSYTVQPGDTLSAIAEETGVPLEEIERLNPEVDAQTLHAGQKIKLSS